MSIYILLLGHLFNSLISEYGLHVRNHTARNGLTNGWQTCVYIGVGRGGGGEGKQEKKITNVPS